MSWLTNMSKPNIEDYIMRLFTIMGFGNFSSLTCGSPWAKDRFRMFKRFHSSTSELTNMGQKPSWELAQHLLQITMISDNAQRRLHGSDILSTIASNYMGKIKSCELWPCFWRKRMMNCRFISSILTIKPSPRPQKKAEEIYKSL